GIGGSTTVGSGAASSNAGIIQAYGPGTIELGSVSGVTVGSVSAIGHHSAGGGTSGYAVDIKTATPVINGELSYDMVTGAHLGGSMSPGTFDTGSTSNIALGSIDLTGAGGGGGGARIAGVNHVT